MKFLFFIKNEKNEIILLTLLFTKKTIVFFKLINDNIFVKKDFKPS